MKNIALIFPGQGSQYVGMGKELYDQGSSVKEAFDKADAVLGFSLSKIVLEGPEDKLRQTQFTQPAIFTLSVGLFNLLSSRNLLSDKSLVCAGHSLGEYSALCCAGAFSFEDGLKLVKARGEYIQKASEANPGTMAAIIGLENDKVKEICSLAKDGGVCEAVNFNSPGQVVIAGSNDSVKKAVELAQAAGAMKAILLNVSGPFHSSLMKQASDMMREELKKYSFKAPRFPVVTNCDASENADGKAIAEKLVRQINSAVLWEDSVKKMIALGAEAFLEVGPQRVLSGLVRRIDKSKKVMSVEDQKSLDKTIEELKT